MGLFVFLAAIATGVFLVLAVRWLFALRKSALEAPLALTPLDKALGAAPIGYTVLCFTAAGALADRIAEWLAAAPASVTLPLLGSVDRGTAVWAAGLLTGLALTTPPIVVFTVEGYFARRLPKLVELGRRAVWAALTGVRIPAKGSPRSPNDEEERAWKDLLG